MKDILKKEKKILLPNQRGVRQPTTAQRIEMEMNHLAGLIMENRQKLDNITNFIVQKINPPINHMMNYQMEILNVVNQFPGVEIGIREKYVHGDDYWHGYHTNKKVLKEDDELEITEYDEEDIGYGVEFVDELEDSE